MIPAKINYTAILGLPFAKQYTLADAVTKAAFNLNGYAAEVVFTNSAHEILLTITATADSNGKISFELTQSQVSQLSANKAAHWALNMTPPSEVKQRYAGGRFDFEY